jgi:Domain of unknown function (DUF6894)
MYYFNVRDTDTLADVDGTELADEAAARAHARAVANELMVGSEGMLDRKWSDLSMAVHDDDGVELFSFPFRDASDADS